MQVGAVLSQTELGADPAAMRDYAQAVQDLGYAFLVTADHVVGAGGAGVGPQIHNERLRQAYERLGA